MEPDTGERANRAPHQLDVHRSSSAEPESADSRRGFSGTGHSGMQCCANRLPHKLDADRRRPFQQRTFATAAADGTSCGSRNRFSTSISNVRTGVAGGPDRPNSSFLRECVSKKLTSHGSGGKLNASANKSRGQRVS